MAGSPPRLAPTLALALAWAGVYLLWLWVRPQEGTSATKRGAVVTTTTTTMTTITPNSSLKPPFKLKP